MAFKEQVMDMERIKSLMVNLRLASEVETAAEMTVADYEYHVEVAQRRLDAKRIRLKETRDASKEAGDALSQAVTAMVQPPLALMLEAERIEEGK